MSRIEIGDEVYVEGGIFGFVNDLYDEDCGDCSIAMAQVIVDRIATHYDGDAEPEDKIEVLLSKCDLL
jgi:preprotein translocase subunit YajC